MNLEKEKSMSMHHLKASAAVAALVLLAGGSAARAEEEVSLSAADQTDLAITIYNQGLAQVRDRRQLALAAGVSRVHFAGVAAQIQPSTSLLKAPGLRLIEQNFDYDLLTPAKLLSKAVGENVRIYRTHPSTGEDTVEVATVLSGEGGAILKIGDRIEILSEAGLPGRIVFDKIPPNLRAEPTLTVLLETERAFEEEVELTYLTSGIGWRADYVGQLDKDAKKLDLQAWITLNNRSGATYKNAELKLVAGDVNRARDRRQLLQAPTGTRAQTLEQEAREEQLGDYHLYTVPERTTIKHNQQKQVALFHAGEVTVSKEYRMYKWGDWGSGPNQFENAEVRIRLENTKKAGLGLPIPQGIMRFYMDDADGNAQFVGEDRVRNLPVERGQWFMLGAAFDVTVSHKRTFFDSQCREVAKRLRCTYEVEMEATLKNAREGSVGVAYSKQFEGKWEVLEESAKHEKENDRTALWRIEIPAEGMVKLTYRYKDGLIE
jgi:hypothetical protein